MDDMLIDVEALQNTTEHTENGTEQRYCICRSTVSNGFMIMCDYCEEWFHGDCVGVTDQLASKIDTYCCAICKKSKPGFKTTYKDNGKKQNRKKLHKRSSSKEQLNVSEVSQDAEVDSSMNDSVSDMRRKYPTNGNATCPDFVDTTVRKAKTVAYEKFKSPSVATSSQSDQKEIKPKREKQRRELKQCYGPGCTRASLTGSKYCSDKCGMALAQNRIIEILPQRICQWKSVPSAVDEISSNTLTSIREQQLEIQKQIEAVDGQIILLIDRINQAKRSTNFFEEVYAEDSTPFDCLLCGMEIQKNIEKHLEQCYKRLDRKVVITEHTRIPDDFKWNVFCNQRISRNVYCKKLRVLCPLHYKEARKNDEVCGYPLFRQNGVTKYCGNIEKNCSHINWEEKLRAELDLEKLNLLLKLSNLKKEESKIRSEMSMRGGVLGLMLHQTIAH